MQVRGLTARSMKSTIWGAGQELMFAIPTLMECALRVMFLFSAERDGLATREPKISRSLGAEATSRRLKLLEDTNPPLCVTSSAKN